MPLRYRQLRLDDLSIGVDLIAKHPEFGPQYEQQWDAVYQAWSSSIHKEAFVGKFFEEVRNENPIPMAVGIFVFVTDEFMQEAKEPPFFWFGPELGRRISSGASPLLSDKEVRRRNSTSGLNLVPWPTGIGAPDRHRPELTQEFLGVFIRETSSFRIKEAIFQTPVAQDLHASLLSGAILVGRQSAGNDLSQQELQEIVSKPHLMYLNRELALARVGSWAASLFSYSDPQIGFSRAEQRLLEAALCGLTDEELITELQISLSAVKKTWRSIYFRVEEAGLPILPALPGTREEGDRGKGKRHRLLNYVREHPEELRPVSMKLLRQSRVASSDGKLGIAPSPRRRVGRSRSDCVQTD